MSEAIVSLAGITKAFSGVPVLRGIDCAFVRGKVHCLLGENGAGKSTLVKIISGAYSADAGSIHVHGEERSGFSPLWARLNGINTIYQEIDLVPNLAVWANVLLGAEPRKAMGFLDRPAAMAKVATILAEMDVDIDPKIVVKDLSLAQQQMIAIAKALAVDSELIILDEPTAVFTRRETEALFRLIRKLVARNKAIVFISHHLDEVFEIGDWITVLRDGALISTGPIAEYSHDRLVQDMVGRNISSKRQSRADQAGPQVMQVRGLADQGVVQEVSFDLCRGEILCLAGLVGSGRSETAKMIVGAQKRKTGSVTLEGRPFDPRSPADALEKRVVYLPEDRKTEGLALDRSAADNMGLSLVQTSSRRGWVGWKAIRDNVARHMQLVDVDPPTATKAARYFSGGNQQKQILARIMMVDPEVLVMDEPTRGVDVGAREQIYAVIRALRDRGKAILIVSSDLEEVLSISDRILVMSRGRIAGEIAGAKATEEAVMRLAFSVDAGAEVH